MSIWMENVTAKLTYFLMIYFFAIVHLNIEFQYQNNTIPFCKLIKTHHQHVEVNDSLMFCKYYNGFLTPTGAPVFRSPDGFIQQGLPFRNGSDSRQHVAVAATNCYLCISCMYN